MYNYKDNEFIAWYPPNLIPEDVASVWKPKDAAYYVHIPFCTAICDYCAFSVQKAKDSNIKEYVDCLKKEILVYASKKRLSAHRFICGHFGGGTPSVLDSKDLISINDLISDVFDVEKDPELTVEVNPISFTLEKAKDYKGAGINRISFGVQSFASKTLKTIGRPHGVSDIYDAIDVIHKVGWKNFSLDLIYGVPGETMEQLEDDLEKTVASGATHISCFRLEIIPFTALQLREATGLLPERQSVEELNKMDDFVSGYLTGKGYKHYGAFNFAKPGYESVHNDIAFKAPQGEYIGFGNSSYSFINNHIYCNHAHLPDYVESIQAGRDPIAYAKKLTAFESMSRYFVLGIKFFRIPRAPFIENFGLEPEKIFGNILTRLLKNGMLVREDDDYCLSKIGLHYVNNICKEFYSAESRGEKQFVSRIPNLTANQINFYAKKVFKTSE